MNKPKFTLTLVISQIVGALFILIAHGFIVPSVLVPDHLFGWVGFGVLRVWLETAAVVLCWVAVLRFGLVPVFARETRGFDPDNPFAEAMPEYPRALVVGFGFILILTAATLLLHPFATAGQQQALRTSELARFYLDLADKHEQQGNLVEAMDLVEESLLLSPAFADAQLLRDRVYSKVASTPAPEMPEPEVVRPSLPMNLSFADIMEKAEGFYAAGDFFSALYYADLALTVSGRQSDPGARELREKARGRIETVDLSTMEQEARRVFVQKRESIAALEAGRYVQSYYLMRDLERRYRDDPDVIEWMPRIQDALKNVTFFIDEAQTAYESGSLGRGLYWLEKSVDGERTWIWTARLSSTIEHRPRIGDLEASSYSITNYYLFDIEAAVLDSRSGDLLAQGYVPFAKAVFLGDSASDGTPVWSILTDSLYRESGSEGIEFIWTRTPPAAVLADNPKLGDLGIVDLPAEPPLLIAMGTGGAAPATMNIAAIFSGLSLAEKFGQEDGALKIDFLRRISTPLIHLLMFAWLLGSAWTGRIRKAGANIVLAIGLLPVILVAIFAVQETLVWAAKLLSAFLLPLLGFGLSIVVLVAVGFVLLLAGLIRTAVRSGVRSA